MGKSIPSKRNWKDALLSSGLPLEHSVRETLKGLGLFDPIEFRYLRRSETGAEKLFSVDITASQILDNHLHCEFLFECKYRHDSVNWVFCPSVVTDLDCRLRPPFAALDDYCGNASVSREHQKHLIVRRPICTKGIELLADDENPKGIVQAIQQVRFGVSAKLAEAISFQASQEASQHRPQFVVLPFIVTTANLWILRSDATLETVRSAQELNDAAERVEIAVIRDDVDDELSSHNRDVLFGHPIIAETIKMHGGSPTGKALESTITRLASHQPWLVFIVHYSKLRDVIEDALQILASPKAVQAKRSR